MKWLHKLIASRRCRKGKHDLDIIRVVSPTAQVLKCKHCGAEYYESEGVSVPLEGYIKTIADYNFKRFDTAGYLLKQNVKEPKR